MKIKIIIIDTSTVKGIKKAEKLQNKGYNLYPSGYSITPYGLNKLKFEQPKS